MMELDLNTRDRLADILTRDLTALYQAKKDVEAEWDAIESERRMLNKGRRLSRRIRGS